MANPNYGMERGLRDLTYVVEKQHRESAKRSKDMAENIQHAFSDAHENSEKRYQAMQELAEQMKIGQAIQVIQYGMDHGLFFAEENERMQNLYASLSDRVIGEAEALVKPAQHMSRGSEFDGMFENDTQELDSHVLE